MARNVLGTDLITCSTDPMTGFFRTGHCDTCGEDAGQHTVCAQMTEAFLEFSRSRGNDLTTPLPEYGFPGLEAGDFWCLCRSRWEEAHAEGVAPRIRLEATHASVLEYLDLDLLKSYAI
ncbi:DUF2237 domain-containing protein [Coraliomargarita sinensis]|uniref:DUF2237 domain-containing protein n=1 Tax=Coraliomargarita sinensis TaxID=2174842 RepID=A0A317ZIC5_9BACT|nr:DUF2237 domain-containing protein [Coraliomargarita sinensis]PXA04047.1 DUF2237 domain-containing protein [Coraliomargarita sinensis]